MNYHRDLLEKLTAGKGVIGVVGLGYVGLPLALRYADMSISVVGYDVDAEKVESLRKGRSYIEHVDVKAIPELMSKGLFDVTSDPQTLSKCDALILCVPTPLNAHREPDLTFVINSINSLLPYLRRGQVLSLESTTYPGTTEDEIARRIREKGFSIGEDFFVVYSPEREDPGNIDFSTSTIPKICGGVTSACLDVGLALYDGVIKTVVPVSSPKVAEMTKLLENIHRAVNIGLINEMKIVADAMGIDIFEVIDAAATKPFGFTAYYPGPGLGGHCIPIDPFYLTWKAREYGIHTRFIELAGEVNEAMPARVVDKVVGGLNEHSKSLRGAKVLVLGVAYKKNVDDMRESPSVKIMEILRRGGAVLCYSDPHVPKFPALRSVDFDLQSVDLTPKVIQSFDVVIMATDHDEFDLQVISENAKLIVDSRGVFRCGSSKVIRA